MLLSLAQAGEQLGKDYRQTLSMVRRGVLRARNLNPGGQRPDWAVPQSAIDEFLRGADNVAAPVSPPPTKHKPVRSMFGES